MASTAARPACASRRSGGTPPSSWILRYKRRRASTGAFPRRRNRGRRCYGHGSTSSSVSSRSVSQQVQASPLMRVRMRTHPVHFRCPRPRPAHSIALSLLPRSIRLPERSSPSFDPLNRASECWLLKSLVLKNKLAIVACTAYRHTRADSFTVAAAILAERPQCWIECRTGAGDPRRATEFGFCDCLLPCRLDL